MHNLFINIFYSDLYSNARKYLPSAPGVAVDDSRLPNFFLEHIFMPLRDFLYMTITDRYPNIRHRMGRPRRTSYTELFYRRKFLPLRGLLETTFNEVYPRMESAMQLHWGDYLMQLFSCPAADEPNTTSLMGCSSRGAFLYLSSERQGVSMSCARLFLRTYFYAIKRFFVYDLDTPCHLRRL